MWVNPMKDLGSESFSTKVYSKIQVDDLNRPIVGEHVVSGEVVLTVSGRYALSTLTKSTMRRPVKECVFIVTETESVRTELMR